jgi:hypothetical protein
MRVYLVGFAVPGRRGEEGRGEERTGQQQGEIVRSIIRK